jgi:hypothetical protein
MEIISQKFHNNCCPYFKLICFDYFFGNILGTEACKEIRKFHEDQYAEYEPIYIAITGNRNHIIFPKKFTPKFFFFFYSKIIIFFYFSIFSVFNKGDNDQDIINKCREVGMINTLFKPVKIN